MVWYACTFYVGAGGGTNTKDIYTIVDLNLYCTWIYETLLSQTIDQSSIYMPRLKGGGRSSSFDYHDILQ